MFLPLRFPTLPAFVLGSFVLLSAGGCGKWGGTEPTDGLEDVPPGPIDVTKLNAPTFPNASVPTGATWARESVHPIVWTVPVDLGPIDETATLEASFDGGAIWQFLDEVAVADQLYRWVLPGEGPAVGRARVTFHRADRGDNKIPVRRLETADAKLGPSQKRKYTWEKVAQEAPFGPRDGAGGLVFDNKMWLIGGWNEDRFPSVTANDVWSSTDGANWTQEKPNTFLKADTFDRAKDWEGRHFAGYHVFDGKMWIVGGDAVQGRYQTDVWSSPDGRKWTRHDIHTSTPRRYLVTDPQDPSYGQYRTDETVRAVEEAQFGHRTRHVTSTFRGKLFLMGGQRIEKFVDPDWPGAPGKLFNDVWTSPDGASWTQVQTTGPMWAPRALVSEAVEHDARMWLVGGGAHDDPEAGRAEHEYRNDIWSTADGATWEETAERPPFSPRIWHNVKVFDGRIWVINGYDGDATGSGRDHHNLRDAWYSTDGRNWYDGSPPTDFAERHAGTVWVYKGALFVGSGNAIGADPVRPDQTKWHADVWKMSAP